MRMISASLVVLALVAAEPAFAGCGSHGGGYGGGYRARVVKSPIVVKKVVKREPRSSVRTAAVAAADKPEATARVVSSVSSVGSVGSAVAENSPAKPVQTTPSIVCQEYSAAVGEMITVPCS
jgi:hypothetical protein